MSDNGKSFEELVNDAPPAQAAGTVSLVGMLAKSSEPGKFVLTLPDGGAMTLATAAVKGHEVLGATVGQTIVRVDVEAADIPATSPTRVPDMFKARNDLGETHHGMGRALPFALATAHQAALSTVAALEAAFGAPYLPPGWHVGTGIDRDPPAPTTWAQDAIHSYPSNPGRPGSLYGDPGGHHGGDPNDPNDPRG